MISVEIDKNSGFCGGVIRAITTAEKYLKEQKSRLFSLGSIVHNEEELARLEDMGLVTIDKEDLDQMVEARDESLLIRAHGEPPAVYDKVRRRGFSIIDCTCPVVLKLQRDIREAFDRMKEKGGRVLLYGKVGHPEVLGLVGQVEEGGITVIETPESLDALLASSVVNPDRDIELFSQTTMSPSGFRRLWESLSAKMSPQATLSVHNTICSQVASRHKELSDFALNHDVIIFVSGKASSNGKVLCDLCKSLNIRTFNISSSEEILKDWFRPDDRVGVSGATSTPKWLLEEVAATIENLQ